MTTNTNTQEAVADNETTTTESATFTQCAAIIETLPLLMERVDNCTQAVEIATSAIREFSAQEQAKFLRADSDCGEIERIAKNVQNVIELLADIQDAKEVGEGPKISSNKSVEKEDAIFLLVPFSTKQHYNAMGISDEALLIVAAEELTRNVRELEAIVLRIESTLPI